mmetsp:Transcript_33904/g.52826  ORF Transcript_33904/g.52826 Transcript_33904/m.52826 type:complete len:88 (-) Transcript_33904:195-458(-)
MFCPCPRSLTASFHFPRRAFAFPLNCGVSDFASSNETEKFRVSGSEFMDLGLGFRAKGFEFGVWGSGLGLEGMTLHRDPHGVGVFRI